jgi:hypothetical protein
VLKIILASAVLIGAGAIAYLFSRRTAALAGARA